MSGLKATEPQIAFSGAKVTPDEIDRYEIYQVTNPNTLNASAWFGTWVVAGTAAAGAMVIRNAIADYPRNAEFAIAGSATGLAGTASITGKDQFGVSHSETFGFGSTDNGGTVVGTTIFASVTSGTLTFGTAVGNGTARLGVGTTGTTSLFGLPFKVGGTTDLRILSVVAGTGAVTVNGGTIAAFIDVPNSAIKAPVTTTGTMTITAWVRPTYDSTNIANVANLSQVT